jgi:tetratricopeptide (TPR) repeat protein
MSLLNDALRKKDREQHPPVEGAAGLAPRPAPPRKRKRLFWIAGIGTVALLAAGLGIGLVLHAIETPAASMRTASAGRTAADAPPQAAAAMANADLAPGTAVEAIPSPDRPRTVSADTASADPAAADAAADLGRAADRQASPEADLPRPQGPVREPRRAPALKASAGERAATPNPGKAAAHDAPPPAAADEKVRAERYFRKALSYHRQGRLPRAIALYREALQLQPNHADARFNLIAAYIDTGEFDQARRIAETLCRQDGANPQVLTNLAVAHIGLGQFREALDLLDRASASPGASMFTVWLHKGIACRGLDAPDAAIHWYQKAEALNPDHPQLLFNLALAYDSRQDYEKALQYYRAYRERTTGDEDREQKGIRRRIAALQSYLAAETSKEGRKP